MHPQFLRYTFLLQVDNLKTCSAPLVSTKLHPSWQSSPFKSGQPYADMCHYPCKHICTNDALPRHHVLHLTMKP